MNLGKLVVKLALGISLASAPIYGCGSEGDSEPVSCIMDSQCKGDRLCIDGYCQGDNYSGENGGNDDNTSGSNLDEEIFGTWKILKKTTPTGTVNYSSNSPFPVIVFERCHGDRAWDITNDRDIEYTDRWIEYTGQEGNSCGYDDAGAFAYGPDWLNTTIATVCKDKNPKHPGGVIQSGGIDMYDLKMSSGVLTLTNEWSGAFQKEIVLQKYDGETSCPSACSWGTFFPDGTIDDGTIFFDEDNPSKQYPCD